MKNSYQFTLEPYQSKKQKHICPNCEMRSFVRYIDTETGEYLPEEFGKCDRIEHCNYSKNPYKEGYHRKEAEWKKTFFVHSSVYSVDSGSKQIMYLPLDKLTPALSPTLWNKNNLYNYMSANYNQTLVDEAFSLYKIGTSKYYLGATVFPLFDEKGCVGGQIVQFDVKTGKTVRWQNEYQCGRNTTWIHKALRVPEYEEKAEKFPIPFGLHLALEDKLRTICLVEAPKTALICSIVYPRFTWLAIGALSWLNPKRLNKLRSRHIVLVPDGGAGEKDWRERCKKLQAEGFRVEIALLKLPAGDDIADTFH